SEPGRATEAPYRIDNLLGTTTVKVNQTQNGAQWNLLGTFGFDVGTAGSIALRNSASGTVSADAVCFVRIGDAPLTVPADYTVTGTLFETDFETDQSPHFTIVARGAGHSLIDFQFDYSTFSQANGGHPQSIPQAPGGSGTRALKLA